MSIANAVCCTAFSSIIYSLFEMELPAYLFGINKQRIVVAFPRQLQHDAEVVADFLLNRSFDLHLSLDHEAILLGQKLIIPNRVYSGYPNELMTGALSPVQLAILNCLFLRHHDGFVRQRSLEQLMDVDYYFVAPFVALLLSEYVIEILFVVDRVINNNTMNNYLAFVAENPVVWQKTESRMVSYWNEYYRRNRYKDIRDYVGRQIVNRLDKAKRQSEVS